MPQWLKIFHISFHFSNLKSIHYMNQQNLVNNINNNNPTYDFSNETHSIFLLSPSINPMVQCEDYCSSILSYSPNVILVKFESLQQNYSPTNWMNNQNFNDFPELDLIPLYPKNNIKSNPKKFHIQLTNEAVIFKNELYHLFGEKKRFSKSDVKTIHNNICQKLCLSKITRSEFRSMNIYFNNYAKYMDIIIREARIYLLHHPEMRVNGFRI
ncbi:hypothetical protein TRFO_34139 [Tritrichomonas foetus]|uniref:Uncharacterized protein n=1 Tax=Tritrichomonas foetus TaxID=1144522 RepID=A0A1J4JLW9_9EUKA|nr:hypothetical protein TRFO_34139 [Tritrichomonas foetus]|eukprot:OHS99415.1 hypothetical protein TRFO_34139 [Tritrichomonas foetus]